MRHFKSEKDELEMLEQLGAQRLYGPEDKISKNSAKLSNKEIQDILQKEIDWCEENYPKKMMIPPEAAEGFVRGLKQAQYILGKAVENLEEE